MTEQAEEKNFTGEAFKGKVESFKTPIKLPNDDNIDCSTAAIVQQLVEAGPACGCSCALVTIHLVL